MSSEPRTTTRTPSYRRHRASGQAVVTIEGKDHYLGRYGTAASKIEYRRVVGEWLANGCRSPKPDLTIAELVDAYWRHVESYYRHEDGTPTGEVTAMRYALRPVRYLYGNTLAADFGPAGLKAVRQLLVDGYDHPKYGEHQSVCRTQVNARIKRIRRMFKWAVESELVPPAVLQGLQAVAPLKRGRTKAKESAGVVAVSRAVVEDTLTILRPMLADMVRLQLETGMRPGELVVVRTCDIDMTGAVWLYRPASHKTAHHGHARIVPIGPKGQEIVRRHLTAETRTHLFSPRKLMEERSAAMRANRKTKVQPSQENRKKPKPRKKPGNVYTTLSYGRAIAEAIKRHNRDKPEGEQIPHWHPHQLRHLRALELKRAAGLDVARAVLGHRSPAITEHYATLDVAKAAEVMGKIG
jgi:integrase